MYYDGKFSDGKFQKHVLKIFQVLITNTFLS